MDTVLQWLEFLILPPGIALCLLLIALVISRHSPMISFFISLSGIISLYLLSTPLVAGYLLTSLQIHKALEPLELSRGEAKGAIVILGGGRYSAAPEYEYRDEVSPLTLERLRYGAHIADKLKLPIVLSGGRRNSNATSEAVIMNQVMVNVFNMNPQFLEVEGTNTIEQAIKVKALLDPEIKQIYLVTHAWHMKRAVLEFQTAGFNVIPAPMGFAATAEMEKVYLPSASALSSTSRALHEYYVYFYRQLVN